MKQLVLGLLMCLPLYISAQFEKGSVSVDESYLEDQFYLGITYNFLVDKPENTTQPNLSYGLQLGVIKDIPLNTNRTYALGVGLGLALNTYYSNLLASRSASDIVYSVLDDNEDFKRNKIETYLVELPLELRWRNSTANEYKFWRIYGGVRLGYVFGARSKFVSDIEKISFANTDVRNFQYGLTFNFGFNTFNIHTYYSLQGLFNDDVAINGQDLDARPIRIGLIFYIL